MSNGKKTIAVETCIWIEVPEELKDGDELDAARNEVIAKLKTLGMARDKDYRFTNVEDVT